MLTFTKNQALNSLFLITSEADVSIIAPDGYTGKLTEITKPETLIGLVQRESNLVDVNVNPPGGSKTLSTKKIIDAAGFTYTIPELAGLPALSPVWLDGQIIQDFIYTQATGTFDFSAINGVGVNSILTVWYNLS